MAELSSHEKLVESATQLFYQHGFHATGIEKIRAVAGVSKMTLYRQFRSKDDLILAVLRSHAERFEEWLLGRVESAGGPPAQVFDKIFDALDDLISGRAFGDLGFHGCLFVKAAGEFTDPNSEIHKVAAKHKRRIREIFGRLARESGAAQHERLADALFLEFEGAYITSHVTGDTGLGARAREVAHHLIATIK